MPKSLLVFLVCIALAGCACSKDDYQSNTKRSIAQKGDKEWQEFVAPLSTRTLSSQERLMKRVK